MVATRVTQDSSSILGSDAHALIIGTLQSDLSCALMLQGDSTGDEPGNGGGNSEWFYLMGQSIAAAMQNESINGTTGQAIRVEYKSWNSGTQDMDAWSVIQAGTNGERGASFPGPSGGRSRRLSTLDIPNPPATDWDVRFRVMLADWTPATVMTPIARQGGPGFRGWTYSVQTNGDHKLTWFPVAGSETNNVLTVTSANMGPLTNGQAYWLRFTIVAATGVATIYTGTDEKTWTSKGTTTVGATTVGNPDSSVFYEIGGRANNVEVINGNVYKVEIRDGIGGPVLNPEPIECWGTSNVQTQVGSPTLFLINGSEAGKGLDWFNDTSRHPKMVRNFCPSILYLSTGHNEGLYRGRQLTGVLDTWLTLTRARAYYAAISVASQNPECSPALSPLQHNFRQREMAAWALRNGLMIGPDYTRAAYRDSRGVAAISKVDGVHPDYTTGAVLWGTTAYSPFVARSHR